MASRNISTALRILSFTRQEIPALASFVFCCHCCDSQLWSLHSKMSEAFQTELTSEHGAWNLPNWSHLWLSAL
uniref:Uncharacterized protein n=1 Tax=Rhizophora mucronata TaxID=61149 RepID=A0A2P2JFX1_RHIMU